MEDGRKAEGFSPHRTNNQGGRPPYLRAAQSGDAFRLSEASPDWAAVTILGSPPPEGEGARVMGAGGSPRQCAINLKRGLPTAPISGGAEGGLSASYLSVGYFVVCRLIVSLYFSIFFYSICEIYRKAEISEPISTFFDISYISSVV